MKELRTWAKAEKRAGLFVDTSETEARPVTRADCCHGLRPCPYVGCKFNLYLDVDPVVGSIKFNHPTLKPEEVAPTESCALDLADEGPQILEKIGSILNVTRERVRQLEERTLRKLTRAGAELAGE